MSKKLTDSELQAGLAKLSNWKLENGEIVRLVELDDFRQAVSFVNKVAELAEAANHHPDIDIRYNRVRLALVTHDSGGITDRDLQLASRIDVDAKD